MLNDSIRANLAIAAPPGEARLKVFRVGSRLSLSQVLPILSDMGVEVVDEDDRGLPPTEGLGDALAVLGGGGTALDGHAHGVGEVGGVGDEHRPGERVVLGLADEVGGDVLGVRARVGEDRDLGRAGLRVDADEPLEQPLGSGDVDVARAGDEADRCAGDGLAGRRVLEAVGEAGDRLGAAGHEGREQQEDPRAAAALGGGGRPRVPQRVRGAVQGGGGHGLRPRRSGGPGAGPPSPGPAR